MRHGNLKIGRLNCNYAAARPGRTCYFISPLPLAVADVMDWAGRYGWNVAVLTGLDWDNDLTPWPAPGVLPQDAAFAGRSAGLLDFLRSDVVPAVEVACGPAVPAERLLAGVSLSGLFAVWAWMQGEDFGHIASLSGSFWYDGFADWMERGGAVAKPGFAYFSLGDQEGGKGPARFRSVADDTRRVVETLRARGVRTRFEWNAGTHYAPMGPRISKMLQAFAAQAAASAAG